MQITTKKSIGIFQLQVNMHCDLFVEPPLNSFELYDVKKTEKIFEIGYVNALKHKEKLLSLINKKKAVINLPEIIF